MTVSHETINDRLYGIITSTDSVSGKILAIMLMVHALKREWTKGAFAGGVLAGIAVSIVVALTYSFSQ